MCAATVIRYERGDEYVENLYTAITKDKRTGKEIRTSKTAYGLVGTLWVGGYAFDTIERMHGYVHMKPGDYPMSSMYDEAHTNGTHGLVVNPWLGKTAQADPQQRNILIHKGSMPSHFEGCIGPGFLEGGKLTYSQQAMEIIWEQCGGKDRTKSIIVTLRVSGQMPALESCRKYAG
ncbi:MAG: hypothetical protein KF889_02240 [Alphaproteobacteria bacterium]|nr:hypothetical protein [Alphaproteobacteria bacterium]MCW5741729.1 hypothetical protein [Alphaproteobacteria bacterium]